MQKENFKARSGFLLTAIGAAVGIGNIWGFPRQLAEGGGVLFLIIYILLVILVGYPILSCEFAVGRETGDKPSKALKAISGKGIGGFLSELASFLMMGYYSFLGGCMIYYMCVNVTALFGKETQSDSALFLSFISDSFSSAVFTLIFIFLAVFITAMGVSKGIERFSKFAVPLLIIMLPMLAICALSLPNATESVLKSLEIPHDLTLLKFAEIFASAGEQMFFSLSLGVGCMITYGAYLNKEENIPKSSAVIAFTDTSVALLAALTVLPISGVLNNSENDGAMLLFVAMQRIFDSYHLWGHMFGFLFFALLLLVALSSAVSMIEVSMSLTGEYGGRKSSAIFCGVAVSIPAILIARDGMGFGDLPSLFGLNWLEFAEFLFQAVLMPISAIVLIKAVLTAKNESMLRRQLGGLSGSIIVILLKIFAMPVTIMVIAVKFIELLKLQN